MGVMDYSCFLCSDEGEQDLTDWINEVEEQIKELENSKE